MNCQKLNFENVFVSIKLSETDGEFETMDAYFFNRLKFFAVISGMSCVIGISELVVYILCLYQMRLVDVYNA